VRLSWRDFPFVLHGTLASAFDDGCFSIAKGAAYSAILESPESSLRLLFVGYAPSLLPVFCKVSGAIVPPGSEQLVVDQFRLSSASAQGLTP
jgi:hypothetical protein